MAGHRFFVVLGGVASVISALGLISSFGLWDMMLMWSILICISLGVAVYARNKMKE